FRFLFLFHYILTSNLQPKKTLIEENMIFLEDFITYFLGSLSFLGNVAVKINVIRFITKVDVSSHPHYKIPENIIGMQVYSSYGYQTSKILFEHKNKVKFLKLMDFYTYEKTEFVDLLKHFQALEKLELYTTDFRHIDISFLHHLKTLKIYLGYLDKFPKNFSIIKIRNLSLMECLYNLSFLTDNDSHQIEINIKMNSIVKEVFKNKFLDRINLSCNNIENYDINFSGFTGRILILSNNYLTKISNSICSLRELEILNLADNLISEIPYTLCNLTNLKELNLCGNYLSITNIHMPIGNLKILDVSCNSRNQHIFVFQHSISNFTLTCQGNHQLQTDNQNFTENITTLIIKDLNYVTRIFLTEEDDAILVNQLSELPNITTLKVFIKNFDFFNKEFYNLKKLETLKIVMNDYQADRDDDFLLLNRFINGANEHLTIKTLSYLRMPRSNIPKALLKLRTVETFHIHNCIISSEFENISKMIHLQYLSFSLCSFNINAENIILSLKTLKDIKFKNNIVPDDMDQRDIKIKLFRTKEI
ncbi:Leucine rich repeat protein, partial [Spraguea lophii 42_110]